MRFDSNLMHQMLEVDRRSGIPPAETLLKIARYYGREEVWFAALKERSHGSVFRRSGKDLVTILSDLCRDDAEEQLLLDERSPGWWNKKRTPDAWLNYWNKIEDGRVMASVGDLYKSFKIIRKMREYGTSEEQVQAQRHLDSLQEDFMWDGEEGGIVSSTRLFYSGKSLDVRIIHHYRCRQPELTTETMLEVPVYRGTSVEEIVSEEKGLAYLHALFETQDDGETIIETAEFVSGKNRNSIVGWTANVTVSDTKYTRASHPERAVWLYVYADRFYLDCNVSPIYGGGRARGVRRESA